MLQRFLLCGVLCWCAGALSAAVEVSTEVATVLTAAREAASPAQALTVLAAYTGKPHALIDLAVAQAHHRLISDGPEGERAAHRSAAAAAYASALQRDTTLRAAHWGLARLAAEVDDWAQASQHAAAALDSATASAAELHFAAHAALRIGDRRLAASLVDMALVRFPTDEAVRRLDLALLVEAGRTEAARSAALDLLDRSPGDSAVWLQLARASQDSGRTAESLAALEAALACDPANRSLRRRLAEGFLINGWPQAALPHVAQLMGEPAPSDAEADASLVELAVRCAVDAGELTRARAWLAAVPEGQRTRTQRLLLARVAVEQADATAAAAALEALIALGESDPGVLAWAGELAEHRGDQAQAAAFYSQAMTGSGPAADAARLRLAALRLRQGQIDEASVLIDAHLAAHPDDATARSLRAVVERRRSP